MKDRSNDTVTVVIHEWTWQNVDCKYTRYKTNNSLNASGVWRKGSQSKFMLLHVAIPCYLPQKNIIIKKHQVVLDCIKNALPEKFASAKLWNISNCVYGFI